MAEQLSRQLQIVHISDLHFGGGHRFNAPVGADAKLPHGRGIVSLAEALKKDLVNVPDNGPVALCITGDFATTASAEEFQEASRFINDLVGAKVGGKSLELSDIYVVAGNHDVVYTKPDMGLRLQHWDYFCKTTFPNQHFSAVDLGVELHDRVDDLGSIFLTLNSSKYIEAGIEAQFCGHIDQPQLLEARRLLEALDQQRLQEAIRVALVHHHPILVPALIDPGRKYEAIHNGGQLLQLLHDFGFHIVLHGHKHLPLTLIDDQRQAFTYELDHAMLVVGGGTLGSVELANRPLSTNSYNVITIKWIPAANSCRIHTVTRGLNMFDKRMVSLLPAQWTWKTLRVDDRIIASQDTVPSVEFSSFERFRPDKARAIEEDKPRIAEYARLRGNLPVVEVRPSTQLGQAYEAVMWLVQHRPNAEPPVSVVWAAGPMFDRLEVGSSQSPSFPGVFTYWDSMLIEALLTFADGEMQRSFVYARLPSTIK